MMGVHGVEIPVTTPVKGLTEQQGGLLLLQVPPAAASLSTVVDPVHTTRVPVIAGGTGFTVTNATVNPPPEKL